MVGKLTTVFTKKEAEAYSSQGLHQEALKLYKELLSTTPSLGDTFKGMVHDQMESLEQELHGEQPQEEKMLSAAEINCIKEGWGANATEGDLLVCTQAFCQIGHYQDALPEIVKLLQKGCAMKKVAELFANCLAHLHTPKQLLTILGSIGKKIFNRPQDRLRLYLLTTEAMVKLKQPVHAYVLYRYLNQHTVIREKAPRRLIAIAKGIQQLQSDQKTAREEKERSQSSPPVTESHTQKASADSTVSWLSSIKNRFFKKK